MVRIRMVMALLCLYSAGCAAGNSVRVVPDAGPDPESPSYLLGEYVDRESRVLAKWRQVRIEATNADFRSPRKGLFLLASHGLEPMVLRDGEPDDESWVLSADWAEKRVTRDGIGVLSACFPDCQWFVDESGDLCIISRRQVDRLAPPEYREARTCEMLVEDDKDLQDLRLRLETERLSLPEHHGSLYEIIDLIQETAKLNIVISAPVRRAGIPDRETSFGCTEERLGEALTRLVGGFALDFTFENRVVLVIARDGDRQLTATTDLWLRPGWTETAAARPRARRRCLRARGGSSTSSRS